MGFASQMENRRKENAALLKKKRFFYFHQETIQKFFFKGDDEKRSHKKLSPKQLRIIRRELQEENQHEKGKKNFMLTASFAITLAILVLIVFVFTEYVFKS